ncbi:O-antigen/teichoic acid export membrane protein [Altererythrobacter atlanticus]|uniref:Lipopolysaccharide biosynthesis protein WzxC n=1 Tax=Croceibacterium atlanticum TaxID=1267766 RepID=A0A0F7KYL7_9SPHN|nr:lipopolysaccharide biosynthesis protein [Croceibacterium atlanticum]AKH44337.1 Lipopolysaccharide biosynthesis protein WzxC [Croceibacterium atlanticum]MBB5733946.1 O-antigen/teichoic acid export membrane protein [Croceibacterium atlanticum]
MSNLRKIGVGSLILTASRAIVNALGFLSTIMVARFLMPEDFGLVAIALSLQTIVIAVTDVPVGQALIHLKEPSQRHIDTAFTMGLLRAIAIAVIFAGASWPVAAIFEEARLGNIMLALAASLLISGIANPRRALLRKALIFKQEFSIEVIGKLGAVLLSISIAYLWQNYWALVVGIVGGQLATLIASYTLVRYRPRFDLSEFRVLWSFSGWMTLKSTVSTINSQSDQLFIGKLLSPTAVGIYSVGDNLAKLPTREATLPLTSVLFPAFSNLTSNLPRLAHAYTRAQGLVTAVALPVGVGFALVAERLVPLAMGEKWIPSIIVIQILSSVFAFQTIGSIAHPLAMAMGETKALFKRDLQLLFIRLPMIVAGLVFGGLMGVLIARVFSGLIVIGFNMAIVKSLIGQSIVKQLTNSWRSILSVGLMVIGVESLSGVMPVSGDWFVQLAQLAGLIAVGGLIYLGGGLLVWIAAGRPQGPEASALEWAGKGMAAIRARLA